ncbi:MAG: hypothetical protein JW717_01420 [Marinilabiliaceae bacterium]|nr:hypothetical protein [Marinilabiliaceae bacterium]
MNRRIMFCSLVLLCIFAGIVQGQIKHQVAFSSNIQIIEETLDDGEMYTRVDMPDLLQTDSVGYPALPVKYVKLLVPASAEVTNVVINTVKKQKLQLMHTIEPMQKPVPINQSNQKQDFVKPDKKGTNPISLIPLTR